MSPLPRAAPDLAHQLGLLVQAAQDEVCLPLAREVVEPGRGPDRPGLAGRWVTRVRGAGGRELALLKVLQSNVCVNRCSYCAFAADRDDPVRVTLRPAELAAAFLEGVRRGQVQGLFLSSGICGRAASSMERMVQTVEILRHRHGFTGYVHLKILPAAPFDLVERAVQLADRVSVNLEAPTRGFLSGLAPQKRMDDLVTRMLWARRLIEGGQGRAKGQVTQFVVGADRAADADFLRTADWLYRKVKLSRAYYSAYRPPDQEDGDGPALTSARGRAALLYRADMLLRCYGFSFSDLVFVGSAGQLPAGVDPKVAWARLHPELFPVEADRADEHLLLRVPGIGPASARRIVARRRQQPLRSLADLAACGAVASRAAPWVELGGRRAGQLRLFEDPPPAGWRCGLPALREPSPKRDGPDAEPGVLWVPALR